MRFSSLLSLATAFAGAVAATRVLTNRHQWEQKNNRVAICIDFDDAQAAAIRAGLPFTDMLKRLLDNGATHIALPEWTLNRLQKEGRLAPKSPSRPRKKPPSVGHWNYLHGEAALVSALAEELNERLPYTKAEKIGESTLVFAGNLPVIGEIGLGFDIETAEFARSIGLGVVPRPVSYSWPDPILLKRTLVQASKIGEYVAFEGDMILGHEMHLDATVDALQKTGLTFVYFAESRHQKGDWFIAKRQAPHIVLGHRLTAAEMVPLDYHAACHNWVHFAREKGIRFCYVNFFKVLHATAPLEGLDYVHQLKHAFKNASFDVAQHINLPTPVPAPETQDLALAGAAAAGVGSSTITQLLDIPEKIAFPITVIATAGAAALPYLEKIRNQAAVNSLTSGDEHHHHHDHEHEHDHDHHDYDHDHGDLQALYPPSYAPKLIALGSTVIAPVASLASLNGRDIDWFTGLVWQVSSAANLVTATSGQEYQLRIEEYKGFNLDWFLPLATAAARIPQPSIRNSILTGLAGLWLYAQRNHLDLLAQIDPGYAESHTHHISAAKAAVGDIGMAIGPKPARKWAGAGPLASRLAGFWMANGRPTTASLANLFGVLGNSLGLVGYRKPERALTETIRLALPSFLIGATIGSLFPKPKKE